MLLLAQRRRTGGPMNRRASRWRIAVAVATACCLGTGTTAPAQPPSAEETRAERYRPSDQERRQIEEQARVAGRGPGQAPPGNRRPARRLGRRRRLSQGGRLGAPARRVSRPERCRGDPRRLEARAAIAGLNSRTARRPGRRRAAGSARVSLPGGRLGAALRRDRPRRAGFSSRPPRPARRGPARPGRHAQRGPVPRRARRQARPRRRCEQASRSTSTAGGTTPTAGPARPTCLRPSTRSSGTTPSTRSGSSSAASRWEAQGPGTSACTTRAAGPRSRPARGSPRRRIREARKPFTDVQEKCLHIYDAVDYALNAFDVPVAGYGGENDPQKQARSTSRTPSRRSASR